MPATDIKTIASEPKLSFDELLTRLKHLVSLYENYENENYLWERAASVYKNKTNKEEVMSFTGVAYYGMALECLEDLYKRNCNFDKNACLKQLQAICHQYKNDLDDFALGKIVPIGLDTQQLIDLNCNVRCLANAYFILEQYEQAIACYKYNLLIIGCLGQQKAFLSHDVHFRLAKAYEKINDFPSLLYHCIQAIYFNNIANSNVSVSLHNTYIAFLKQQFPKIIDPNLRGVIQKIIDAKEDPSQIKMAALNILKAINTVYKTNFELELVDYVQQPACFTHIMQKLIPSTADTTANTAVTSTASTSSAPGYNRF